VDRSAVVRIVGRTIEPLMERLGIPHWHIEVIYGPLTDDGERPSPGTRYVAECNASIPYDQASIRIDPEQIDDEEHLLEVLRHELFHVLVSPFNLHRNIQVATIESGSPADEQEGGLWKYCEEQAVINLERMYLGLTRVAERPKPGPNLKRKGKR
jgi:hypothetical protein